MKLLTYVQKGAEQVGVLGKSGQTLHSFSALGLPYATMLDFLRRRTPAQEQVLLRAAETEGPIGLARVELQAPIPRPAHDLICLGLNFADHAMEAKMFQRKHQAYPVYFSKRVDRAVPHGGMVPSYPDLVDSLDYEVELAVVMGARCWNVTEEQVYAYLFGYTVLNDVSARNIQNRHGQWFLGKSLDGFAPMGPYLVTKDEVAYPPVLSVCSRVNGQVRQKSSTERMLFGIGHVIAELSKGMVLEPGDIISMGTPAGVGMGFDPPRFLKPGDRVECEIESIGTLVNEIQ